jgi:hypothetical protein
MPITQTRLMQIINAAEHAIKKHEEIRVALRELYLIKDLKDYLDRKEGLGETLFNTEVDPGHKRILDREIAHFRVHFKRNANRAAMLRLRRASPDRIEDDEIVDEYFRAQQSPEEILESWKEENGSVGIEIEARDSNQSHEICPSCGVQATFFEKEKHLETCEYKNEAPSAEPAL